MCDSIQVCTRTWQDSDLLLANIAKISRLAADFFAFRNIRELVEYESRLHRTNCELHTQSAILSVYSGICAERGMRGSYWAWRNLDEVLVCFGSLWRAPQLHQSLESLSFQKSAAAKACILAFQEPTHGTRLMLLCY